MDYNQRIDGTKSNKFEFYNQPELYVSSFMDYAKHADIFIAGHYYSQGSPFFLLEEDAKHSDFNIKLLRIFLVILMGQLLVQFVLQQLVDPIYGYNPISETEDDFIKEGNIAVMAVDNLPCELPKDASVDFGNEMLLEKIFPSLINRDKDEQIIENATICQKW